MIQLTLAIALHAFADRLRGSDLFNHSKQLGQMLMGLSMAYLCGAQDWKMYAAYVGASYLGTQLLGWTAIIGKVAGIDMPPSAATNYFSWQVGILKNKYAALVFRGAYWGAWFLPLAWQAAVAYTIAFILCPFTLKVKNDWAIMEAVRGLIAALIAYGLMRL